MESYPALGSLYSRFGKRLLDLALTIPAVVVLAPLMGLLGLLAWLWLGRPVFFRQERNGWHGAVFQIMKFRSMTTAQDAQGNLLPDERRKHPFGDFLRRTSLDELPELFQVISGKMSLVGPRPLPLVYWERYSEEQRQRHLVRPGITGLTQISGRNQLSWEEKFAHDLDYVRRHSLALDLVILLKTVGKVVRREGVSKDGHYTCEDFQGTPPAPPELP